jgi:predicted ester cyclase
VSEEAKQVALRLIDEVMNQGKVDTVDELLADDFVNYGIGLRPPGAHDGASPKDVFRRMGGIHHMTFDPMRIDFDEVVAEGGSVAVLERLSGTHTGPIFDVQPTGDDVSFAVIHIFHVRDGQVTAHWECRDDIAMFRQLRGIPGMLRQRIANPVDAPPAEAEGHAVADPESGPKAVAMRVVDKVLNGGDLGLIDELVAEDADCYGPPPERKTGREGFREWARTLTEAVPDLRFRVDELIGEGDLVVLRGAAIGKQTGSWPTMPASGRDLNFTVIHVFEVKDGQVTRFLDFRDEIAMWSQMGQVPTPLRPLMGGGGPPGGGPPGGGPPRGRPGGGPPGTKPGG